MQAEKIMGSKLKKAKRARKKMGKNLKKALQASLSKKSFPKTIEFCQSTAPKIANEVGASMDLKIGRTSHKLRNPENKPPEWALPAVTKKENRPVYYHGPNKELGYLHPIKMKGLCLNCHGKKKQLADGVPEMLAKKYPKDEATGFEVGDLRGWFWVEVPGGS